MDETLWIQPDRLMSLGATANHQAFLTPDLTTNIPAFCGLRIFPRVLHCFNILEETAIIPLPMASISSIRKAPLSLSIKSHAPG